MPLTAKPSNYNLRSQDDQEANQPGEQAQDSQVQEQVEQDEVQNPEAHPNPPPAPIQVELETQNIYSVQRNMASVFRLENFKGDGTQKVDSYLKRFDQFITCTGLSDEQAKATLAWHLEGSARLWFEQLDPEPTTVNGLKDLMKDKFKKDRHINMNVYSMKQMAGESAEDFLRRLETETYKYNISSEIQVQIALNGMDRAIGSAISTHDPKTLDDVKRLTLRANFVRPQEIPAVAQATIPSKLETTMEVLTAAVAKLASSMETKDSPRKDEGCSRCGGRCFSSASCRAMGKTCYKCKKQNHFGNKCRSTREGPQPSRPPRQYYGQQQ